MKSLSEVSRPGRGSSSSCRSADRGVLGQQAQRRPQPARRRSRAPAPPRRGPRRGAAPPPPGRRTAPTARRGGRAPRAPRGRRGGARRRGSGSPAASLPAPPRRRRSGPAGGGTGSGGGRRWRGSGRIAASSSRASSPSPGSSPAALIERSRLKGSPITAEALARARPSLGEGAELTVDRQPDRLRARPRTGCRARRGGDRLGPRELEDVEGVAAALREDLLAPAGCRRGARRRPPRSAARAAAGRGCRCRRRRGSRSSPRSRGAGSGS